jgi:hypothetical protein
MRWRISSRDGFKTGQEVTPKARHDVRQIDLLVVLALLVVIVAAWRYFDDSTALPPSTTAFIVPSQTVHW